MLAVAADIGGTTIKTALVEIGDPKDLGSYRIIKSAVTKTEKRGGREGVLTAVMVGIAKVDSAEAQIIAVGSAGDVDPDTGVVKFATDALPGFTGLNLTAELRIRTGRRVVVINDASAATIGECFFGAGMGEKNVLVLTLGTGLGCSQYIEKPDGLTSEAVINYRLGHIELYKGGRLCLCNLLGCAEQYVSATALKRNAAEEGLDENLDKLFLGFQRKSEKETRAIQKFFCDFAAVIRYAVKEYRPELILVGGGITEAEGWWEEFSAYAKEGVSVPVRRAELKNKAGIWGAVYNALHGRYKAQ